MLGTFSAAVSTWTCAKYCFAIQLYDTQNNIQYLSLVALKKLF